MNFIFQIMNYESRNFLKNKWVIFYFLFYFIITETFFILNADASKVLLSLSTLILILVPLITLVYGTIVLYNSSGFIKLILTQPVRRRDCFIGLYLSVLLPFIAALSFGISLPFIINSLPVESFYTLALLLLFGISLTAIFTAIAFWISFKFDDKSSGLAVSIITWLIFAFLYDGLVLFVSYVLNDYPIEKIMIILTSLNPIDLVRIVLLMQFDYSALMGYTGAIYINVFGSDISVFIILIILLVWLMLPLWRSMKLFINKDF